MTIVPRGGGITGGGLAGGGGVAAGAVVVDGATVVADVSPFVDPRRGLVVLVVDGGGLVVVVVVVAAACTAWSMSRAHALSRSFVAPSGGTLTSYRTVAVPRAGTVTKN